MSEAFSIRLPDEQRDFLDRMAKATDRSRNQLISAAVGQMLENYKFVLSRIEQGEADLAAGRTFNMDEVAKRTQAVIDRAE